MQLICSKSVHDDACVKGGHGEVRRALAFLVHVLHFLCTQVNTGNSILSELTKAEMSKKVGHFGFSIRYTHENGTWMAVF